MISDLNPETAVSDESHVEILPLTEHSKQKGEIPLPIREFLDKQREPFDLTLEATPEVFQGESEYLQSNVIVPYLEQNNQYHHLLHSWENSESQAGITLEDLLALTNNILWSSSGSHKEGMNSFTRGSISDCIGYPERGKHTNCRAFNQLYVMVFETLAEKLNPQLLDQHRLLLSGVKYAPDVSREYMASGGFLPRWNQSHAHITILSANEQGDIITGTIDPYHTTITNGSMQTDDIIALDFTRVRGLDALVTAYSAIISSSSDGKYISSENIVVIKRAIAQLEKKGLLDPKTDQDALLLFSALGMMAFQTDDLFRNSSVATASVRSNISFLEQLVKNQEVKVKRIASVIDEGKEKEGIVRDAYNKIANENISELSDHSAQVITAVDEQMQVLGEILGTITAHRDKIDNYFSRALDYLLSGLDKDEELSPDLLLTSFDTVNGLAIQGYISIEHMLRYTEILRKIKMQAGYEKFRRWARIKLENEIFSVPVALADKNEGVNFNAWLDLHRAFAEIVVSNNSQIPKVKLGKSDDQDNPAVKSFLAVYSDFSRAV